MNFLGKLLTYIRPAGYMMVLAVLLGCLAIASNVSLLAVSAYLISLAALHPPLSALSTAIVGVRFFGITRAVLRYLERYTSHSATFSLMGILRAWVYARIEPLFPADLQRNNGELLTMLMQDVETMKEFYLRLLAPPIVAGIALLTVSGVFFYIDTSLIYVMLTAFLICGVLCPAGVYYWNLVTAGKLIRTRASLNGYIVDSLAGMTELAAFHYKERLVDKILRTSDFLAYLQARTARMHATTEAIGMFIMHASVWWVLYLAIYLIEVDRLSGLYLAALVFAVQSSFEAILPLTAAGRHLPESVAAVKRLFSLPEAPAVADALFPDGIPDGAVNLTKIQFRYTMDSLPVLKNISLSLRPGKHIAVVGPSGAGKSSLLAAILQFGYCDHGTITLDGVDSKTLSPEVVRKFFAVVPQHIYLFHASIKDNILLAKPTASLEELETVIRQAALTDFIQSLPQGYDTLVGQHGQALSGGQRQRIGIARALLKEAPVLILDEPFSQLDVLTAGQVLQGVRQAIQDRSSILITHHLTGLENMDEIVVVHEGEIVERGSMDELLECKGLFYQLWNLQQDILIFDKIS